MSLVRTTHELRHEGLRGLTDRDFGVGRGLLVAISVGLTFWTLIMWLIAWLAVGV